MKALILAAGRGSRMGDMTVDCPKGMVELCGVPLVTRMINTMKNADVTDIAFATGYSDEALKTYGLPCFHNQNWDKTNMVQSLAYAQEWFKDESVIVSYSDIFVHPQTILDLKHSSADFAVAYDPHWQELWEARFENVLEDAESFKMDGDRIVDIGRRAQDVAEIQGQYMGIFKLTPSAWRDIVELLGSLPLDQSAKLSVTEMLQMLISRGVVITGVANNYPWGEVDNVQDLAFYESNYKDGQYGEWFEI